jgi:hypothetical protein
MRRGRPLKFQSPKELQDKIDEYFQSTPIEEQMITGLAVHLDTSRETLCDYESTENSRKEFSDTVKKAKERIEFAYEKRGLKVGNAFDIFRLKNMGWRDNYQNEITGAEGNPITIKQVNYGHNDSSPILSETISDTTSPGNG